MEIKPTVVWRHNRMVVLIERTMSFNVVIAIGKVLREVTTGYCDTSSWLSSPLAIYLNFRVARGTGVWPTEQSGLRTDDRANSDPADTWLLSNI